MRKNTLFLILGLLVFLMTGTLSAQERFYATTPLEHAEKIRDKYPDQVAILDSHNEEAVVYITSFAADELHHNVVVHGPGYVFQPSLEEALAVIRKVPTLRREFSATSFTINQQAYVNKLLDKIDNTKIRDHIKQLEAYGTRHHTTQKAKKASNDLKSKWESLAGFRSDIKVKLYKHSKTSMPSVIMTIKGSESPDEYVVLGGHLDSIADERHNAPGADDNASGIATITEIIRVLMESNFKPKRTVEFMAFSAEEVGLVGSNEIATKYKNNNVNIISMFQLDMTNFRGQRSGDMAISEDTYISSQLNQFLIRLIQEYNGDGNHEITYTKSRCDYGCSDHYSFSKQGYNVVFPFEAKFGDHNKRIHTPNDRLIYSDETAMQSSKFAKLALEYVIEVAKHGGKKVNDKQAPTTPTNLTASGITSSSVTLKWKGSTDNIAVAGYTIYKNGQKIGTSPKPYYEVFDLEPTTSYEFSVSAYDESDNSSPKSKSVSVTTKKGKPCAGRFVLTLKTDNYPDDIAWRVFDKKGNTVLTSEEYRDRQKTYVTKQCLPSGCYTFRIRDEYGDGICCSNGQGSFKLVVNGDEIISGGNYGSGTQAEFCVRGGVDTTPPTVPTNLSVSKIGATKVRLVWNESTDNIGVTGYEVFQNSKRLGVTTSPRFTISNLAPNNTYKFSVLAKDKAGNKSERSKELSVKTKSEERVNYCNLEGKDSGYEWIDYVAIGGERNSSQDDGGYKDNTNKVFTVSYGNQTINLSAGFGNRPYKENWFVWIDFNQDGKFTQEEQVVRGSSFNEEIFKKSFNVPSSAKQGVTRMRIAMGYNEEIKPCGSFSFGEVEDYSINIKSRVNADTARKVSNEHYASLDSELQIRDFVSTYPNPVTEDKVKVTALRVKKGTYKIFNVAGSLVKEGVITKEEAVLDVSRLATGNYIIKVDSGKNVHSRKIIIE